MRAGLATGPKMTPWPKLRSPVAVIQPLPGIGDMVWHVPHIRAIAAFAGAPVTVLTKPRSLADQLLAAEASVADVGWIDINPAGRRGAHDGIAGFFRLVRMLRTRRFGSVVLLHHSETLAAAAFLAGIPDRRGYGWGGQRLFLSHGPVLPRLVAKRHQHTRATRYLLAAGVPLPDSAPSLTVPPDTRPMPWADVPFVAVGIGSSERLRQWGAARFRELVAALRGAGWPAVVLVGGAEDAAMAEQIAAAPRPGVHRALGWPIRDVIGLLAKSAFYVGNNTGVMNISAAVGTRTYALFGTTPTFDFAPAMVAVTAPDIGVHDGMERLTLAAVQAAITADRGRLGP